MYCTECGKALPEGAKFCPECGHPVETAQEAPFIDDSEVWEEAPINEEFAIREVPPAQDTQGRVCPRCGGNMTVQVVTEHRNTGCFTVLLYILLAVTVIGLLVVIPLMLRKKTETVTYAVCQSCGYQQELRRT